MRPRHRTALALSIFGISALALAACSGDVMRPDVDIAYTSAVAMPSPALVAPPDDPDVVQPYDIDPGIDAAVPGSTDTDFGDTPGQDYQEADNGFGQPPEQDFQRQDDTMGEAMPIDPSLAGQSFPPRPLSPSLMPRDPGSDAEPRQSVAMIAPPPRMETGPRETGMPQDEIDCRRQLKRIGATFRDLPPLGNGGSCGIAHPVELSKLSGNIAIKPAAKLTCQMALTFARWTKKELAPATRLRYLTGVKTINNASSYSCRRIAGSRTMSEHSKGNAIDISSIVLDNGRKIGVEKKGLFSFREKGLLNNVRGDACSYFSTVLGPGYNHDHRDHFHFDLATRRNGRVSCH
ncbi:MAG: extensin family protein [Mesorhizobium sp.]